jgi:hypothetical protein
MAYLSPWSQTPPTQRISALLLLTAASSSESEITMASVAFLPVDFLKVRGLRLLFEVVFFGLGISAQRGGGPKVVLRSSARLAGVLWYVQTGI